MVVIKYSYIQVLFFHLNIWINVNRSRLVVSIGKIYQECASGICTSRKVAVFFKIDFKVGCPQIIVLFSNGKL